MQGRKYTHETLELYLLQQAVPTVFSPGYRALSDPPAVLTDVTAFRSSCSVTISRTLQSSMRWSQMQSKCLNFVHLNEHNQIIYAQLTLPELQNDLCLGTATTRPLRCGCTWFWESQRTFSTWKVCDPSKVGSCMQGLICYDPLIQMFTVLDLPRDLPVLGTNKYGRIFNSSWAHACNHLIPFFRYIVFSFGTDSGVQQRRTAQEQKCLQRFKHWLHWCLLSFYWSMGSSVR